MSNEDLQALLAQLHSRLSRAKKLDAESRELLVTVSNDIEKALARKRPGGKGSDAAPHETKLEALAVQFEADHPALADVLRRMIDAIAKAGV